MKGCSDVLGAILAPGFIVEFEYSSPKIVLNRELFVVNLCGE